MTDEIKEVDYYLRREWVSVEWRCPYCQAKNIEAYDDYDPDELWYGNPETFCINCGKDVKLGDKGYD